MNLFLYALSDGSRAYWRGPEETIEQALAAIQAAGVFPIFVERLK